MVDSDKKLDVEKGDDVLKRMLKTPPKQHVKDPEIESDDKMEPGETAAKKLRPEEDR